MWSQFLTIHTCFPSHQKPLKIANEWHRHYYEDALDLDLINLQTLVFQLLFVIDGFQHTTQQNRYSQCITIPCLRTRNPNKGYRLHDRLERPGPIWSPSWLCRWTWLCCSPNEWCQLRGMAARVRETRSCWWDKLVMNDMLSQNTGLNIFSENGERF